MGRALLSGLVAALVLTIFRPEAVACSPPSCMGGGFVPRGPVPANLPALVWEARSDWFEDEELLPEDVVLTDSAGRRIPVTLESMPWRSRFAVRPSESFSSNTSYALEGPVLCYGSGVDQYAFTTTEPRPLPTELGSLRITEQGREVLVVSTSAGSCAVQLDASFATVQVQLVPEAQSWSHALLWETEVDGRLWSPRTWLPEQLPPGESWAGPAKDRVYAQCTPPEYGYADTKLSPGTHLVVMRASIPGTDLVLETPPLEVTLTCDGEPADPEGDESKAEELETDEAECACLGAKRRGTAGTGSLLLLALAGLAAAPGRRYLLSLRRRWYPRPVDLGPIRRG